MTFRMHNQLKQRQIPRHLLNLPPRAGAASRSHRRRVSLLSIFLVPRFYSTSRQVIARLPSCCSRSARRRKRIISSDAVSEIGKHQGHGGTRRKYFEPKALVIRCALRGSSFRQLHREPPGPPYASIILRKGLGHSRLPAPFEPRFRRTMFVNYPQRLAGGNSQPNRLKCCRELAHCSEAGFCRQASAPPFDLCRGSHRIASDGGSAAYSHSHPLLAIRPLELALTLPKLTLPGAPR
jgi:hypothetical protein